MGKLRSWGGDGPQLSKIRVGLEGVVTNACSLYYTQMHVLHTDACSAHKCVSYTHMCPPIDNVDADHGIGPNKLLCTVVDLGAK